MISPLSVQMVPNEFLLYLYIPCPEASVLQSDQLVP